MRALATWCSALNIDGLECRANHTFCNFNCPEPVNIALIQTNGVPTGPEGDGMSGGYSGIAVAGANRVLISATSVLISTAYVPGGCPAYALSTAKVGSSGGMPELVQATGGFWNAATALVIDAAPAYLCPTACTATAVAHAPSPSKTRLRGPKRALSDAVQLPIGA